MAVRGLGLIGSPLAQADGPIRLDIIPVGDWDRVLRLAGVGEKVFRKALNEATKEEAQELAKKIRAGIRSQAPGGKQFKRLRPTTLAIRRAKNTSGRGALLATRTMVRAIKARQVRRGRDPVWTVGIKQGTLHPDGRDLVELAEKQERGYFFTVRPEQVRKFMMRLRAAGLSTDERRRGTGSSVRVGGLIIVRVPARPFFAPILKQEKRHMRRRFIARMNSKLTVELG